MTAIQPETPTGAYIQRNPDGRHAVMDQNGNLLGLHNSHQSALRQVGDYYGAPHQATPQALSQQQAQPAAPQQATPQNLAAGVDFGAALIHAHPHANPDQLIAFAHQMGQEHAQNALGAYAAQQPAPGRMQEQGQLQQGAMPGMPMPLGPQTARMI